MIWGYRADIFSHVDTMHQRDRLTNGQTPDDSKGRAYSYASRCKNNTCT